MFSRESLHKCQEKSTLSVKVERIFFSLCDAHIQRISNKLELKHGQNFPLKHCFQIISPSHFLSIQGCRDVNKDNIRIKITWNDRGMLLNQKHGVSMRALYCRISRPLSEINVERRSGGRLSYCLIPVFCIARP